MFSTFKMGAVSARVLRQASAIDSVRRNDLPKLGQPSTLREFVRETLFQHADSDEGGGRCTWGGAEQGDKGIVCGCDQLGAELQYAAPLLIGLNDLDALSGDRLAPVLSSGLGKELAKSRELMRR